MHAKAIATLISAIFFLAIAACTKTEVPNTATSAMTNGAKDIPNLLAQGDYNAVLDEIDKAKITDAEKLGTSGRIILDGLVDPKAKTRPKFTIDEGLSRMEKAALLGRETSVNDLAAVFTTGVGFRDEKKLLLPAPELADCWNGVKSKAKTSDTCIALRKSLGVPKN
jgi:hypothetical protein